MIIMLFQDRCGNIYFRGKAWRSHKGQAVFLSFSKRVGSQITLLESLLNKQCSNSFLRLNKWKIDIPLSSNYGNTDKTLITDLKTNYVTAAVRRTPQIFKKSRNVVNSRNFEDEANNMQLTGYKGYSAEATWILNKSNSCVKISWYSLICFFLCVH